MGSPADKPRRDSDEGPQHEVRVPAFEIGKRRVIFAEWDTCVIDQGCTKTRPTRAGVAAITP
ncbi:MULTISPECIES: hypothetical protein [unclassified Thiocapsa]|uniref:hypothetical protein n=1 Tax=unclassified Thiocapsa TaxID=2641286 RepID=UPI0035B48D88